MHRGLGGNLPRALPYARRASRRAPRTATRGGSLGSSLSTVLLASKPCWSERQCTWHWWHGCNRSNHAEGMWATCKWTHLAVSIGKQPVILELHRLTVSSIEERTRRLFFLYQFHSRTGLPRDILNLFSIRLPLKRAGIHMI